MRIFLILLVVMHLTANSVYAQKRIALSFDDSPRTVGPVLTAKERQKRIIAGLKKSKVKQAVFFVNPGNLVEPSDPKQAWPIMGYTKAGHVIANHSYTHATLSQMSVEKYLDDLDEAETWLKGRKGYRPWFRYPFLDEGGDNKAKRDAIRDALKQRGLRNGYVTAEAADWLMISMWMDAAKAGQPVNLNALRDFYVQHHVDAAHFYEALARKTLGRSPVQVLLLHETDLAAFYIADLVAALRKDGWTIVTADTAYADPIADILPDATSAQGNLTEMIAWKPGMPKPGRYPYIDDVALMRAQFETKVLRPQP